MDRDWWALRAEKNELEQVTIVATKYGRKFRDFNDPREVQSSRERIMHGEANTRSALNHPLTGVFPRDTP